MIKAQKQLLLISGCLFLQGNSYSIQNTRFYSSRARPPVLKLSSSNENYEDNPVCHCLLPSQQQRRSFIQTLANSLALSSFVAMEGSASAIDLEGLPKITQRVFMDVRISRSDGTFYVKDTPNIDQAGVIDEPFYGQLVLGLFGNRAPNHVKQFMQYVEVPFEVDNPLPSYSRARFTTLDINNGLLIGGVIPGLDVKTLAGGNVLEYGSRVIPAKLWIEPVKAQEQESTETKPLSHDRKGLLTHRNLDLTPSFGIITRTKSTFLDGSNTVFGCILEDKDGFLNKVVDLPVLTDEGKVSRTELNSEIDLISADGGIRESLASSVFTAQRKIFRDAAKTFGDSRLDKVYNGKLLRRIEVTKVGVL
mmetsp:Transcript_6274/g.11899  ORF Transcript_6274/g.11899 Transcript_6274/m.11899 type:complete len:363 (-) Transcript_6274:102-1190(-)